MYNRIIRTFIKFNREKFINNKMKYNLIIAKNKRDNFNKIIVRKYSTYNPKLSFGINPKGPNFIIYLLLAACGCYISENA